MRNRNLQIDEQTRRQIAFREQQKRSGARQHLAKVGLRQSHSEKPKQSYFVPPTPPTSNFTATPQVSNFNLQVPQSNFAEKTVNLQSNFTTPTPISNFDSPTPHSNFMECGKPQPQKKDAQLSELAEKRIGYGIIVFLSLLMLFFFYTMFSK